MGRILVIVGVVMLVLAFIVPFASSMGFLTNIGGFVDEVTREPTAADLCETGETLDIVQGASTTTGIGSNTTTGRPTSYFCVNAAGERRDVTGSFVEGLFSDVASTTGGIGSFLTGTLATVGLSLGGIALIIVGAIMATRGSRKPRQVFMQSYPTGAGSPIGSNDSPVVGTPPKQPYINYNDPNFGKQDANSVINFVRDQLDAAYRNGQISREEYDRAIEKMNRR